MTTLACTGLQKSLTKKLIIQSMKKERKSDKYWEEKEWEGWFTIPWFNTLLSLPNMTTLACTVYKKSLTKNFIIQTFFRVWKERKRTCLPNMTTLACTVLQQSLTKHFIIQSMDRKKIGQMLWMISMKKLVRNPIIQYFIIILHTKYDYSS